MSARPSLSVVIPCFNEAENMPLVMNRFDELMRERTDVDMQVLLVDGGSTDGTSTVLQEHMQHVDAQRFKVILQPERGGYGCDIMTALAHSSGDVLCWTHADMQTDPADVLRAFDLYCNEKNSKVFIKGQRKNRRLLESFFTFGMQMIVWLVLKTYISDINAQPKMFSRKFYQSCLLDKPPKDFSLDLFALYKAKKAGYLIKTIPVYFAKRQHGEAKGGGSWTGRIRLIQRTFCYIFKLKEQLKS